MKKLKKVKVLFTVFVGLLLGFFGFSKLNQADNASQQNQGKIASAEGDTAKACSVEGAENNVSRFISCSGFLE